MEGTWRLGLSAEVLWFPESCHFLFQSPWNCSGYWWVNWRLFLYFEQVFTVMCHSDHKISSYSGTPLYGHPDIMGSFVLSIQQKAHAFSLKLTCLIWTPVNTDNGHFPVSRVTNSHTLSTPLYGHFLSVYGLFSNFLRFCLIFSST